MTSTKRADPFADARDTVRQASVQEGPVRQASVQEGFPSRVARLRRRRTGRNVQVNIKATRETVEQLIAISDQQGWAFGETLEHALTALELALREAMKVDKRLPSVITTTVGHGRRVK
jgi:hypothetical protein